MQAELRMTDVSLVYTGQLAQFGADQEIRKRFLQEDETEYIGRVGTELAAGIQKTMQIKQEGNY